MPRPYYAVNWDKVINLSACYGDISPCTGEYMCTPCVLVTQYNVFIFLYRVFTVCFQLPSGVDLTLTELQEMATRQQRQIEEQQQMLVAKEQRLKFLKQQELRHQQIASENERLRKLREKVEAQELKLKKLRALRGQVNEQKSTNNSLSKYRYLVLSHITAGSSE